MRLFTGNFVISKVKALRELQSAMGGKLSALLPSVLDKALGESFSPPLSVGHLPKYDDSAVGFGGEHGIESIYETRLDRAFKGEL